MWNLILLITDYLLTCVQALWLLPTILGETTISRTLLLCLVSVMMGIHFVFYVTSMILHARKYYDSIFATFYTPYYLACLIVGVVEVFFVSFFYSSSSDVDPLDSTTYSDPINFTSILIYHNIVSILLGAWISKTFAFSAALTQALSSPSKHRTH